MLRQCGREQKNRFVDNTTVTHSDHGSVTVDARAALDGPTRNELLEETSVYGRFDTTWLKHASMETMSWLFDRKGRRYQLKYASFARGRATLGDTITWTWAECGEVCFTPTISISLMPVVKRRHFGRFCLVLVFNFPSFLYLPAPSGTLVPLSGSVRRPHKWMLNPRGNMRSHWVSGHLSGTFCVGSMAKCDTIASRLGGSPVLFVDHPALTRIVQRWAGHH